MDTTDEKPLNYTLEAYAYEHRPTGYRGELIRTYFDIIIEADGGPMRLEVPFSTMIESCEKYAPKVHAYIEKLSDHLRTYGTNDQELIEALEAEGFDFEQLVNIYLDNTPAKNFYPVDAPPPIVEEQKVRIHEELQKEDAFERFMETYIKLHGVAYSYRMLDRYFKAAHRFLYQNFKRLHELDDETVESVFDLVRYQANRLGKIAYQVTWLAEGFMKIDEQYERTLNGFAPGAEKKKLLESLKPVKNDFPFTLDIMGFEEEWEVYGTNTVRIWVHIKTEKGHAFEGIFFENIREMACMFFPDLFRRIEELEASLKAVSPKEAQVVRQLRKEGWDFMPVLVAHGKRYLEINTLVQLQEIYDEEGEIDYSDYWGYTQRLKNHTPDNHCKWKKCMAIAEDKLTKPWLSIMEKHCPTLFTVADERLRNWAIHEVHAASSNLFFFLEDKFPQLYDGEVDWRD